MEIWKQINNYPRYEVSTFGRIRVDSDKIKEWGNTGKYIIYWLRNDSGRKPRTVHSLVMEAFETKLDPSHEINHKDCNKSNNYLNNLEYISHHGNLKHAEDNGRMAFKHRKGKDHPSFGVILSIEVKTKMRESHNKNNDHPGYSLTDKQVLDIKKRRCNGELVVNLAFEYNQTKANISMICTGKRRHEIGPEYTIPAKRAKCFRRAKRTHFPI